MDFYQNILTWLLEQAPVVVVALLWVYFLTRQIAKEREEKSVLRDDLKEANTTLLNMVQDNTSAMTTAGNAMSQMKSAIDTMHTHILTRAGK